MLATNITQMSIVISLLIISLCLSLISCGKKRKGAREVVVSYYTEGKFNGAILIAKDGRRIYDTLLGYSDFYHKTKLHRHTVFYIASLSKPVTAIGIMLLQQKGLLHYDDLAATYVKGLPGYAGGITIRQLLTHTSGIRDYEGVLDNRKQLTNQDVIKWLNEERKLQFIPGSQFAYSNSGYIILSLVIESISGLSYSQFLQENLFTPLGMLHTKVFDKTNSLMENRAIGFNKQKALDDYSLLTTGDGGIYATVEDLYVLDQALRHGSLLSEENIKLMYEPPTLLSGKMSKYGFGWFIDKHNGSTIAQHTGGLDGFRALFWRDLDNDLTIITLTNQGDAIPLYNFREDLISSLGE
jgi:CubicO group peptidase (beta-lactamase class C family)